MYSSYAEAHLGQTLLCRLAALKIAESDSRLSWDLIIIIKSEQFRLIGFYATKEAKPLPAEESLVWSSDRGEYLIFGGPLNARDSF